MALRLVLSIPLADILAFRKLSRAYFGLLEVLAHNHTSTVAAQVCACVSVGCLAIHLCWYAHACSHECKRKDCSCSLDMNMVTLHSYMTCDFEQVCVVARMLYFNLLLVPS